MANKTKRQRDPRRFLVGEIAEGIAAVLNQYNAGLQFGLMIFDQGRPLEGSLASNAARPALIEALRNAADRLEEVDRAIEAGQAAAVGVTPWPDDEKAGHG